jgi:hypothetical protein
MPRLYRPIVATLVLVLASCTSAKQITTPDGRQGYTVGCGGSLLSWEDCFERASEICGGRSYDVFTRVGEESALVAAEPQHLHDSTTNNRSMVIACKGS